MQVDALDHVNITCRDLDETVAFYSEVFDLGAGKPPAYMTPGQVRWMTDAGGRAILHLVAMDFPGRDPDNIGPGGPTGAIDHVAFTCTGFDETIRRLKARDLSHTIKDKSAHGLRQVFVHDPNGVLLELNFRGD